MSDVTPEPNDNHDEIYQDGIKLLEDAFTIFSPLNTAHGKSIAIALQGLILLGKICFNSYKEIK